MSTRLHLRRSQHGIIALAAFLLPLLLAPGLGVTEVRRDRALAGTGGPVQPACSYPPTSFSTRLMCAQATPQALRVAWVSPSRRCPLGNSSTPTTDLSSNQSTFYLAVTDEQQSVIANLYLEELARSRQMTSSIAPIDPGAFVERLLGTLFLNKLKETRESLCADHGDGTPPPPGSCGTEGDSEAECCIAQDNDGDDSSGDDGGGIPPGGNEGGVAGGDDTVVVPPVTMVIHQGPAGAGLMLIEMPGTGATDSNPWGVCLPPGGNSSPPPFTYIRGKVKQDGDSCPAGTEWVAFNEFMGAVALAAPALVTPWILTPPGLITVGVVIATWYVWQVMIAPTLKELFFVPSQSCTTACPILEGLKGAIRDLETIHTLPPGHVKWVKQEDAEKIIRHFLQKIRIETVIRPKPGNGEPRRQCCEKACSLVRFVLLGWDAEAVQSCQNACIEACSDGPTSPNFCDLMNPVNDWQQCAAGGLIFRNLLCQSP